MSASDRTDDELVAELHNGNVAGGLTALEARYGQRILHFAQGICRDRHLAQDITQDVFAKLLQKHDHYRPGTNFRAWLFEIARNQALSALRTRQRLPRPVSSLQPTDTDDTDPLAVLPAPSDDRALELEEFMSAFHAAVDALPQRYREVFDLCVSQGMAYQAAGRKLDLPTRTVAIRIMRARKRLFGALHKHLDRLRRPPACFQ